jgi:hypothetical protein
MRSFECRLNLRFRIDLLGPNADPDFATDFIVQFVKAARVVFPDFPGQVITLEGADIFDVKQ